MSKKEKKEKKLYVYRIDKACLCDRICVECTPTWPIGPSPTKRGRQRLWHTARSMAWQLPPSPTHPRLRLRTRPRPLPLLCPETRKRSKKITILVKISLRYDRSVYNSSEVALTTVSQYAKRPVRLDKVLTPVDKKKYQAYQIISIVNDSQK